MQTKEEAERTIKDDFEILGTVLIKCKGTGINVTIPDGTKRHDGDCAYTIAELTSVKYEDSNALVKALLPNYIKNSFNKNNVKGDMVVNGVKSAENSFNGNTTGGDFIVNGTKDN